MSTNYMYFLFFLCLLANVVLNADFSLMAPNLTPIARDLHIDIGLWNFTKINE